jgi:beta-mannosidase
LLFELNDSNNSKTVFTFIDTIHLNEVQKIVINYILPIDSTVNNIELWWPSGYGLQYLYNFKVTIQIENKIETKTKDIGFRSVELIEEKTTKDGLSFYIKINGIGIFLKGSNWIPATSFRDSVNENYLQYLLKSTKEANMNILRVIFF